MPLPGTCGGQWESPSRGCESPCRERVSSSPDQDAHSFIPGVNRVLPEVHAALFHHSSSLDRLDEEGGPHGSRVDAFNKLKDALCSTPVLASPQLEKEFTLQTDASGRGVGGVLSQLGQDDLEHPVAYFSGNCYHVKKITPLLRRSAWLSSSVFRPSCMYTSWGAPSQFRRTTGR